VKYVDRYIDKCVTTNKRFSGLEGFRIGVTPGKWTHLMDAENDDDISNLTNALWSIFAPFSSNNWAVFTCP